MTELQMIEIDLLRHAIEICNKYNLEYFLVCGSALGAIKYKGFIPWDDDVDIALPRSDYEKFIKIAICELPDYVFLQDYKTDKDFPLLGTKLRNSSTTFIQTTYSNLDLNHGVFIDVFPLDGSFSPNKKSKRNVCKMKHLLRQSVVKVNYHSFANGCWKGIRTNLTWLGYKLFGLYEETGATIKRINDLLKRNPYETSDFIVNFANSCEDADISPKSQFGDGTWASFEGLKVRVPEKYDEYLTQKYGDWRADLPEDQKVGHHYAEVIDLERPYTDYIVKLKNGKIRLKTSEELLSSGITPPEGYKY